MSDFYKNIENINPKNLEYYMEKVKEITGKKIEFAYNGNTKILTVISDIELTIEDENKIKGYADSIEDMHYFFIKCNVENKYFYGKSIKNPLQCPSGHIDLSIIKMDIKPTLYLSDIENKKHPVFIIDGKMIIAEQF